MQSYALYFQSERWYPEEPILRNRDERMNSADLWVYAKSEPERMVALIRLAHRIENILEDGYIESRMLNRYPGVLGYSLDTARAHQFEMQPTLTEAKDFLEYCEKLAEDAEASEDGEEVGGVLGALLSALKGSTGEAKGPTLPR